MLRKIIATLCVVCGIGGVFVLGFGTNHSYITTPSMYPTIPPGSEIFVQQQREYHVGQVIEFHANGLTWAHRLIAIKPNGEYVTKGDNPENARDVFVPALTQKDVVGAVVSAPRWLGFPELIAHHPSYGLAWLRAELKLPGKLLVIGLAICVSLLSGSARRQKAARERDCSDEPRDQMRFIRRGVLLRSSRRLASSAPSERAR